VYRGHDFSVFLFGFAKSDRGNVSDRDLKDLRTIAAQWLRDRGKLERDRQAGILIEVKDGDEI
jgi:hypothetical protein